MTAGELRRFREEQRLRKGRKPDRGHIVERTTIRFGNGERSGDVFRLVVEVKSGGEAIDSFKHFCGKRGIGYERENGQPAWLHEGEPGRDVVNIDCFGKTRSERVHGKPFVIEVAGLEGDLTALIEATFVVGWHYVHSSRGHRWNDGVGRDRETGVQQKPSGPAPKDASASVRREIRRRGMVPDERRNAEFAETLPAKREKPHADWRVDIVARWQTFSDCVRERKAELEMPEDAALPEREVMAIVSKILGRKCD